MTGESDPRWQKMARHWADATKCQACGEPIRWGFVDYSDTPGWVHDATDEAKCDVDVEDSDDAFPLVTTVTVEIPTNPDRIEP